MNVRWLLPLIVVSLLPAQRKKTPARPGASRLITEFPVPDVPPLDAADATKTAIAGILALTEEGNQWPYEGVYREDRGNLPVGYRVGGTSITIMGLISAPGYREDETRVDAVNLALKFVLKQLDHKRMSASFIGSYDVRGWGHVYALQCLLHLQDFQLVPAELSSTVTEKVDWLVKTLVESAIPEGGGWNYSRRAGYMSPKNSASLFMTAPALQALFHAKARGHSVSDVVVEEALSAINRARTRAGGFAYSSAMSNLNDKGEEDLRFMDLAPGSAARAAICETTMMLAGRGDEQRHQKALELFFSSWDYLAKRKSQRGTHIKPYGIAPYYFMFGHLYCAQAIEQIKDKQAREGFRAQMRQVLARSIDKQGTWNDRQFGRSAGYGTAMALMTMHMNRLPKPHAWRAGAADLKGKK
ncbi:MAG: hypothetical protein ACI85K_001518 [Hyphomicrobiaceae bacterium]|jgi:hypothetical protein